jgi:hypothetical protein
MFWNLCILVNMQLYELSLSHVIYHTFIKHIPVSHCHVWHIPLSAVLLHIWKICILTFHISLSISAFVHTNMEHALMKFGIYELGYFVEH